jgi:hypothetical protein
MQEDHWVAYEIHKESANLAPTYKSSLWIL